MKGKISDIDQNTFVHQFISAVKLVILTWRSMGLSLFCSASSGQWRNCSLTHSVSDWRERREVQSWCLSACGWPGSPWCAAGLVWAGSGLCFSQNQTTEEPAPSADPGSVSAELSYTHTHLLLSVW